ncbi:MAG: hypothetical protein JRH18_11570 [Deltaproteobacteria bacterium]|nr:hypothetical protein [Deltaproteobacteria bacterium]MBW2152296.1 hypothetical protein [Deltaproteobacteria bacterium]
MKHESFLDHAKKFRSELRNYRDGDLLDKLRQASLETKLGLAVQAGNGDFYDSNNIPIYDPVDLFMAWLSWVQSNHHTALQWWYWVQRLSDKKLKEMAGTDNKELEEKLQKLRSMERDDYILELWESMEEGKSNYGGQITVKNKLTHWSYYQNYFFQWFLQRFNIPGALAVFKNGRKATRPFTIMAVLIVFGVAVNWICFGMLQEAWWGCLVWIFLVILLCMLYVIRRAKIPRNCAIQVMIPRLGATIGIGYLYLFSASSMVKYVLSLKWHWGVYLLISAAMIAAVWLYLAQTILRHVKPKLQYKLSLLKRGGSLMQMAVIYSAVGLHLSAPIITSGAFLDQSNSVQPKPPELLVLGSVALAIGVALQLVWEDKPVTEPI